MKKFFTFLFAALMSVSMSAKLVQQDIALNQESWGWGYNTSLSFSEDGVMTCTLTGEWGAASTGWDPEIDLTGWDKIVILVENMNGCDGEWFKLKAYLRDKSENEGNQMEGLLGLDAEDRQQNYLVIDLHQEKEGFDLTHARILAIQCQPNGAVFKISKVYLEKEVEDDPAKYYIIGSMTEWAVNEAFEMIPNNSAEVEEYMYELALTTESQFKVVKVEGESQTWFPDGMGNNYGEHGEITKNGNYTVFFRPNGDGGEGWFYNCIYAEREKPENHRVILGVNVPAAGVPESVVVSGSFGEGWSAETVMEKNPETGWFVVYDLVANEEDEFKFHGAGGWENELFEFIPANEENPEGKWEPMKNLVFGDLWADDTWKGEPVKMIELDFSDNTQYAWSAALPEQGIENIELTVKAQKVVVDGMLYIVRDGKMFNATGAQVR